MRRWLSATIVTALVLVSGLAMLGAAQESPVSFPPRTAGDVVVYQTASGNERAWEVLEDGTWKTANGVVHDVAVARMQVSRLQMGNVEVFGHAYAFVSRDGAAPIAASQGSTAAGGMASGLIGGEYSFDTSSRVEDGRAITPCGLFHSLQGASGRDMQAVGCEEASLRLDRITTWQGSDVYVFRAGHEEVWMRPDLAYPVKIIDATKGTLELTGVSRMDTLPPAVEAPGAPGPLPDVAADGTDIVAAFDHLPWDAADVLAAADADATLTDYHDWRAAHPDAVLRSITYGAEGDNQTWSLRWADATSGLLLYAQRSPSDAHPMLVELGVVDSYDERLDTLESGFGIDSDPSTWHAVPDLEALTSAWQAYMGHRESPTSMSIYAPDVDGGTYMARVESVYAKRIASAGLLDQPEPQHYEADGFGLEYQNDAVSVVWTHTGRGTTTGGLTMPTSQTEPVTADASVPPADYALVVGGAALAGLLAWLLFGLKSLPFATLWTRAPRDHPTRSMLIDLVTAQPGIHYQEIVKTTGLGKGTIEHHLRRLVHDGRIVTVRNGRYVCHFLPGTTPRAKVAAGTVKSDGARRVMAAIRDHPGADVATVTAATGLSPGTVSHHLKRLRESGIVESWRDGRSVRMRVA